MQNEEPQDFLLAENFALGVYRHFKGGRYRVIATAKDSETEEWMAVYYPLYSTADEEEAHKKILWVRPLAMFLETIEREGLVVQRFVYCGQEP